MDVAIVAALINEVVALIPTLISLGVNITNLVQKLEAVWSQANVSANDPQFATVTAAIAAARAHLVARDAALKV